MGPGTARKTDHLNWLAAVDALADPTPPPGPDGLTAPQRRIVTAAVTLGRVADYLLGVIDNAWREVRQGAPMRRVRTSMRTVAALPTRRRWVWWCTGFSLVVRRGLGWGPSGLVLDGVRWWAGWRRVPAATTSGTRLSGCAPTRSAGD